MKNDTKFFVVVVAVVVVFCILMGNYLSNEFDKADVLLDEELRRRTSEIEPHIIAEKDGCKVYAFRPNVNTALKYFVKCENSTHTSTDNSYKRHADQTEVN